MLALAFRADFFAAMVLSSVPDGFLEPDLTTKALILPVEAANCFNFDNYFQNKLKNSLFSAL